ncbi:hypothetical protein GCM10009665_40660 [Kitasatospora nipponensis]|uniref:Uncharacterized protein n=1 Tax=Kitasatospora nipponensis TaxID=258049 RepID=A0ABP4H124_9ACTN
MQAHLTAASTTSAGSSAVGGAVLTNAAPVADGAFVQSGYELLRSLVPQDR